VNRLGPDRTAIVITLAGGVVALLSIIVFYVNPELGRSSDLVRGGLSERMSGVAAGSNALGVISAITLLFGIMHFSNFSRGQRTVVSLAMFAAAITLLASDSRTSMIALVIGLALWAVCRGGALVGLLTALVAAIVACLVLALLPDVLESVSRTGSEEDITTLNNRSRVWAVALEHISKNPLLGEGYGASSELLRVDDRLFGAAVNAHNVYLEVLFSGGLLGFALFVTALATAAVASIRRRRPEALVGLIVFMILGVTESTPLAGLPAFASFAYLTVVSLCIAPAPRVHQARARPARLMPQASTVPALAT
jgi:O-antigen ligase